MKLITVSGPPSSGKTSVIMKINNELKPKKLGVAKFDCLSTYDEELYKKNGIYSITGLSGNL